MTSYRACRRRFDACLLVSFIIWTVIIYLVAYRGDEVWKNWSHTNLESEDKPRHFKMITEQTLPYKTCSPQERVVLLRTNCPESDTMATILQRYGHAKQLSFAMSADRDVISLDEKFHRNMAREMLPPLGRLAKTRHRVHDILASHVRYDHREINSTVPNATHITVLMEPVKYFEYVFSVHDVDRGLHLIRYKNPIGKFMENPQAYTDKRFKFWFQVHNGQIYNLGLDHADHDDPSKVSEKVENLQKELNFVLIAEYFDESLVVLRKKLCWRWHDILYFHRPDQVEVLVGKKGYLTPSIAASVREWNMADSMLYKHFNNSFWEQVLAYGPTFQEDVQYFRKMRDNAEGDCLVRDGPESPLFRLKEGAPTYCHSLARSEKELWQLIRNSQSVKA
ncbi:galactosylceramide sulfotransferase-like [Ptychodera flava]|uniref:galactosylceramide sulfotransferase-like n=1 Tax=Ptychodera flava TaxID=63121 RepID=UPI00396A3015